MHPILSPMGDMGDMGIQTFQLPRFDRDSPGLDYFVLVSGLTNLVSRFLKNKVNYKQRRRETTYDFVKNNAN